MRKLTADLLRQILHYDPERGVFTWLPRPSGSRAERAWNARFAGTRAGTGLGYVAIGIFGRRYKAHRLAWLYVHGEWPGRELDHINCDKSDNRIANLRQATRSQNIANSRARSDSTSGIKGVRLHKPSGRWMARLTGGGKRHIGLFDTPEAAHAAYVAAAEKHFGEFSRAY
jgi:hypothetical protein